MVGVGGFEPPASWTRTKRDTKLRHTPIANILYWKTWPLSSPGWVYPIKSSIFLFCIDFFRGDLMAYRISYPSRSIHKTKISSRFLARTFCALGLFCGILLGSRLSEAWAGEAKTVFRPGENAAAQDYARGMPLREILIGQCRQVLREGGFDG